MATKKRAARETPTASIILNQARHYMRYLRKERGETTAQIANSEGVSQKAIEKSIRQVEIQRGLYTQQNLNASMVGMLMGNLGHVDLTLKRMFKAKDYMEQKNPDGSIQFIPVDDKATQLKAMEVFGKFLDSMQPRSAGVNVKVQQNNANQANATGGKVGGYEDMLRGILDNVQNFNQLPSQTGDVIEAEEDADDEEDDEVATIQTQ